MQFYETRMGKQFFEATMPSIARQLETVNKQRKQKVVPREYLEESLDKGFRFVAELSDGSIIVESQA